MSNPSPAAPDIVSQYGSVIWATADVLRTNGFKASDWPNFMMPFFALMLLESRVVRARNKALQEFKDAGLVFDPTNEQDREEFVSAYKRASNSKVVTFHDDLVFHGQGLHHIANGATFSSFGGNLRHYLSGFDQDTKRLLGVEHGVGQKAYLDIKRAIEQLEAKSGHALLEYGKKWANVELSEYDSSAITTLEEHIKRRWADISAETAGEQYTPSDLIDLVTAFAVSHFSRHPLERSRLKIYDPTCGGGNMLYGVEDGLRKSNLVNASNQRYSIQVFGQELNDTLFALASIESRFRPSADIREGNTLTEDQFEGEKFDLIVANPPYGVDWKSLAKDIEADQSGRFDPTCRPPVSDGQHLFLQHIQHHLSDDGMGLVFCSGSTLFSGDAGGGESNARSKYFLHNDHVHGIIQLPKNEFFNTGINTYLWFFWKNKPENLKRRAFMLNADTLFEKLRKSLGSKNCQMSPTHIAEAVDAIGKYEEVSKAPEVGEEASMMDGYPLLKSVPVDVLHYNKVPIKVTRSDDTHGAFEGSSFKLNNAGIFVQTDIDGQASKITFVGKTGTGEEEFSEIVEGYFDQADPIEKQFFEKPTVFFKRALENATTLVVQEENGSKYEWNIDTRLLKKDGAEMGRASVNVSIKWASKKGDRAKSLMPVVEIGPDVEKDVETTPFSFDEDRNTQEVNDFLSKWVKEKFEIVSGDIQVGCEINFNRLFPRASVTRSSKDIETELEALNQQLADLDAKRRGVA